MRAAFPPPTVGPGAPTVPGWPARRRGPEVEVEVEVESAEQYLRGVAPLGDRELVGAGRAQNLYGDLVCSGVQVLAYSGRDGAGGAPGHHGVDEPVAAAVHEIRVVEAELPQIVQVV